MTQGGIPSSPEQMQRYFKAAQVFTPSSPVDSQELFAGRPEQITQVLNAVAQKGQHVILYGERGVGKTSLANYILQIIEKMVVGELTSAIINCDGVDQFFTIWQKVFRELGNISNQPSSEAELLPEDVTPEHIRYILQQQSNRSIIVIDELDRVSAHSENSEYNFVASAGSATELLADTIKTLSDHSIETTIILVGVADSVDELINEHASIERSLVQVQMPRMSPSELYELLDKRLKLLEMDIQSEFKEQIAFLSQGLPSYTHLLALHASQHAIMRNSKNIEQNDLGYAISQAIQKAFQSIVNSYYQATSSSRETIYAEVLLACALTSKDNLGYFAARDVEKPMSAIMKRPYKTTGFSRNLKDFCDDKRGAVLQKRGRRFGFVNPMMQPYVIMHGLANELIDFKMLKESSRDLES